MQQRRRGGDERGDVVGPSARRRVVVLAKVKRYGVCAGCAVTDRPANISLILAILRMTFA